MLLLTCSTEPAIPRQLAIHRFIYFISMSLNKFVSTIRCFSTNSWHNNENKK